MLSQWRILASEPIHDDRWISLRADQCVTAEGVEVSPCYVLDYPGWVHIVAIVRDERVLFVEQYRHGAGAVALENPPGRMDPQDASPEAADGASSRKRPVAQAKRSSS